MGQKNRDKSQFLVVHTILNETGNTHMQYHLISAIFISTKYITFQNLRTISTGFEKIKDQKMEKVVHY